MRGLLATIAVSLLAFLQPATQSAPDYEAPVELAYWRSLDFEAQWVHYKSSKKNAKHWLQFLAENEGDAILEWLVISEGWGFAGPFLENMSSPRWIRAACWNVDSPDSHTMEGAQKALLRQAPLVLDWLDKNPKAIRASLRRFVPQLEKKAEKQRTDSRKFLGYFDLDRVFAPLTPPKKVVEFGDRPRAQPNRVYLHQIDRSIGALINGSFFDGEPRRELLELTEHPVPRVRQRAYLAFTKFPSKQIPAKRFFERSRSAPHAPERNWAMLAYSYRNHPDVYLTLCELVTRPDDPAWQAVASRLGDLCDGFSRERVAKLELAAEMGKLRDATQQRIRARKATSKYVTVQARRMLERAAWAHVRPFDFAQQLETWTRKTITKHRTNDKVAAALRKIRTGYEVPGAYAAPERVKREVRRRVRELAAAILRGK